MCAQLYVGSVLQKSYLRFLGTLFGCLFSIAILLLFDRTLFVTGTAILLATFVFSYLATGQENLAYTGTLGAVTTAIILLTPTPTVLFAIQRFSEISVGLLIATLVSQLVLPIHARTHLARTQAATLKQLRELYRQIFIEGKSNNDFHDEDEAIVKTLLTQRQLAKESKREPLGSVFNIEDFTQSLYCEREALRAILFMQAALTHLPLSRYTCPAFHTFNESIQSALNTIIQAIEKENPKDEHLHALSPHALKRSMEEERQSTTEDERFYLDGFLFSAEILCSSLTKLANVYQIPIRS